MNKKTVRDVDVKGKRVFCRVDFNVPMEEGAKLVAVVGLFRHPDMVNNTWKQVLRREDLDPDKPRILEAGNNHLTLQPRKDD